MAAGARGDFPGELRRPFHGSGPISGSAPVLTVELHGLVAVERGVLTVEGGQVAGFAVTRARRRGEV